MSKNSIESVSVLMDGEAGEFELRQTLKQLENDDELQQKWRRLHIARSVLKQDEKAPCCVDISQSVMGCILAEESKVESLQATHDHHVPSIWKQLASMAVAASVTAVVILGYQSGQVLQDASLAVVEKPNYVLPRQVVANNYMPVQYNTAPGVRSAAGPEPEIIRMSDGLERYVEQHRHLLSSQEINATPEWTTDWLPKGFKQVRFERMPRAEIMVFSDGRYSVSICIEPLGSERVPEGVVTVGDIVAVGQRQSDYFVTVVGDVPLMMAERIASSVHR